MIRADWKCSAMLILYWLNIYFLFKLGRLKNYLLLFLFPLWIICFDFINFNGLTSLEYCLETANYIAFMLPVFGVLYLFSIKYDFIYRILSAIIQWLALLPLIAILWVLCSGQKINEDIIIAVWQSDFKESLFYCMQYVYAMLLPCLYIVCLFLIFFFLTCSAKKHTSSKLYHILLLFLIVVTFPFCCGYTWLNCRAHRFLVMAWFDSIEAYQNSIKQFRESVKKYDSNLASYKIPSTPNIAVIIGESQSRSYIMRKIRLLFGR